MDRLSKITLFVLGCALAFAAACSFAAGEPGVQAPGQNSSQGSAETATKAKAAVTYIANEGVMIEAGGKKILVDALHRYYKDAYAYPPDGLRAELENAKGRFSDVDLVLVSHVHGDHFSAESVADHIRNNSSAKLVSSPQVIEAVRKALGDAEDVSGRIQAVPYEWKQESAYDGGVRVRFLDLRHANPQFRSIQNLGHVFEVGGVRFLHIGDADMTGENFEAFKLQEAGIDVAFIPYWFLLSKEGLDFVDRQFKPKHIVAVHIPPAEASELKQQLEASDPRVIAFTKILEHREF